jgi:hypothetical protein
LTTAAHGTNVRQMTNRTNHFIAVSLMVAGIAAGGVCWALDGLPFWILAGISAALVIGGLIFAGRLGPGDNKDGARKK